MKKLTAFALLTLLTGCVAMGPDYTMGWIKDGASQAEAKNKYAKCLYDVGMNKVDPVKERTIIEACMVADGFRWDKIPLDRLN